MQRPSAFKRQALIFVSGFAGALADVSPGCVRRFAGRPVLQTAVCTPC